MNNKIKKLLEEYQNNIIFDRSTYFQGSNLYNVNVKLYNSFDYDKDIILNNIKKNNKDLSGKMLKKINEYLEELSDEIVDELFWDYVNFLRDDVIELMSYESSEVNYITENNIKADFNGRSGGYFGFDIDPKEILSDFENEAEYIEKENEYILIDQIKEDINLLKQINVVMLDVKKQSESISTNEIVEDYILNNKIEEFEEEIASEENIAKFKKENSKEIKELEEKADKKNISIRIV